MMRPTINEESDCLRKKICAGAVDLLPWIPEPSVNNKLKVETS
jgi:hypothetical protein